MGLPVWVCTCGPAWRAVGGVWASPLRREALYSCCPLHAPPWRICSWCGSQPSQRELACGGTLPAARMGARGPGAPPPTVTRGDHGVSLTGSALTRLARPHWSWASWPWPRTHRRTCLPSPLDCGGPEAQPRFTFYFVVGGSDTVTGADGRLLSESANKTCEGMRGGGSCTASLLCNCLPCVSFAFAEGQPPCPVLHCPRRGSQSPSLPLQCGLSIPQAARNDIAGCSPCCPQRGLSQTPHPPALSRVFTWFLLAITEAAWRGQCYWETKPPGRGGQGVCGPSSLQSPLETALQCARLGCRWRLSSLT